MMSKIGQLIEEFYPLIRTVPRVSGTPVEAGFIEKIAGVYRAMNYDVDIQRFDFIGWELLEPPQVVEVDSGRRVPAERVMWSGSTPEIGIEGVVVNRGKFRPWGLGSEHRVNKYAIVSDDGEDLGYLLEDYGHGSIPSPMHHMPYISVSKGDIERWRARDDPVRVMASVKTRFLLGAKTANVVATKKGKTDDEIIVCAHHDTVDHHYVHPEWDVPVGVVDNGSGVVGVMKVAEKLMNLETKKTIRFISFTAEEFNMVGSRYYVSLRDERDELDRIKAVINLDDIHHSFLEFFIIVPNAFYKNLIQKILKQPEMKEKFAKARFTYSCSHATDDWAFRERGIPAMLFLQEGPEEFAGFKDLEETYIPKTADFVVKLIKEIDSRI